VTTYGINESMANEVLFIKNYCNTGERDVGTNETPSGITTPTVSGMPSAKQ
jgi:hypothetical protein